MILVDAMMQIFRCAYSMSDLENLAGRPTGMEFGFLMSIECLRRNYKDEVILCWEGHNNFRYGVDPDYKITRRNKRKKGEQGRVLVGNRLEQFKEVCKWVAENAEHDQLEGDDIIASLADHYSKTEPVMIYSGDKDLHQCLRDPSLSNHEVTQVTKYQYRKTPWDVERFKRRFWDLEPTNFPEFQAWIGDSSDDVPGCRVRRPILIGAINEGYRGKNMRNFDSFSSNETSLIEEHFDSGRYEKNLKLVKMVIARIEVVPRDFQEAKIRDWLNEMEIRSLKICRDVGAGVGINDHEEF